MFSFFKKPKKKQNEFPYNVSALPDRGLGQSLFYAELGRRELWDPATIDDILKIFPKGYIEDRDLFLILAECIANAALYGQAEELIVTARKRRDVLLISFKQTPKMLEKIKDVLAHAKEGKISDCIYQSPGGLGFPILLQIVNKLTISKDCSTLRLWFRLDKQTENKEK